MTLAGTISILSILFFIISNSYGYVDWRIYYVVVVCIFILIKHHDGHIFYISIQSKIWLMRTNITSMKLILSLPQTSVSLVLASLVTGLFPDHSLLYQGRLTLLLGLIIRLLWASSSGVMEVPRCRMENRRLISSSFVKSFVLSCPILNWKANSLDS